MFHITRTRTHTHTRTLALLSRLPRRGADWLHVIVLEDDTGICQLVEVFSHDATRAVHEIQLVITKVICKSHQNTKNVRRRRREDKKDKDMWECRCRCRSGGGCHSRAATPGTQVRTSQDEHDVRFCSRRSSMCTSKREQQRHC